MRKKIVSNLNKILPSGKYKILGVDWENFKDFIDTKFGHIGDIWDDFDYESKRRLMLALVDDGILTKIDEALELAKLDWEKLPIEIKLLIIYFEYKD